MLDCVKSGPIPRGVAAPKVPTRKVFPFYRCKACKGVLTYLQEREMLESKDDRANVCPCGGRTYHPTNLIGLERIYPRVLWFRLLNWVFDY